MIIAIDPGRDKCGLAVVKKDLTVEYKEVVATTDLKSKVEKTQEKYQVEDLVLGDGTKSQEIKIEIEEFFKRVIIVDEAHSTLEARAIYWQDNPPTGWRRLLPTSLQTPPQPIDDYVAVILATRYLKKD
ncbi:hypothetical protein Halha_2409 [Halobacteroides halobius DSM 5150]|uniref:YqgF/RNase H-like domain-containing protein n=1 Tax=Halobacteroides halobius (strain ATCC 35273 / DSM 5150 / MD-1) TaxID=748449 RepID=L0KDZ9_HALHC|nr:hypothetical protein [Halobacteroides halobius]AGB42283.1 hypothetical protein Halha_2409 [Halobacteroides halobius DSM 5150]